MSMLGLENYYNRLAISDLSPNQIADHWRHIIYFINTLKKSPISIKFIDINKCSKCFKATNESVIMCGHNLCQECIMKAISKATDETFDEDFQFAECPICNKIIPLEYIFASIPYECIQKKNQEYHANRITKYQEDYKIIALTKAAQKENEVPVQFKRGVNLEQLKIEGMSPIICKMIDSKFDYEDILFIYCKGSYVPMSISSLLTLSQLAKNGKILFNCTICGNHFDKILSECFFNKDGIEKNTENKISQVCTYSQSTNPSRIDSNIKICKLCSYRYENYLTKATDNWVLCPACKISHCEYCNSTSQHVDCKDEAAKLKREKMEENIRNGEKALLENGMQKCPHCSSWCKKESGCQFIYCTSLACQRKRFFCLLCGCKLVERQHFPHFFDKPYGNQCKGKTDEAKPEEISK